ncbi:hypothetical protein AVEN_107969-1 [Araneus ventricosus]|uniref:Transposable element P transposase-like GTP-binding insertion domain-containing protein n=1 Tax=Araneus ventricosus TaxID=182803 RepID=A0A4Y2U2N7_ARAVE|nr:hypothetical protein AVEN_107969-1 [Araneus ventricosus]
MCSPIVQKKPAYILTLFPKLLDFAHKTKKIYAMYDPPHLLKSVRNNLKDHEIYYEERLLEILLVQPLRIGSILKNCMRWIQKIMFTKKHIAVSGFKRMNVKLAPQVLSHSIASALNLFLAARRIESNAIDPARFIKKMDKLFDTINSRTLKPKKKELCSI